MSCIQADIMKTILILGAGEMQVPLIKKSIAKGYRTIVIDYDSSAPGFIDGVEGHNISSLDFNGALRLAKSKSVNGITTSSDKPVQVVSKLCETLGLKGVSREAAAICGNKYRQRSLLEKAGYPTPRYELHQVIPPANHITGWPMIIKPVDSSASRGVKKISSYEELIKEFPTSKQYSDSGEVILEEVIGGKEYSVEAVTASGHTTVIAITEKRIIGSKLGYFVEDCHIVPANIPEQTQLEISRTVESALKVVGVNNTITHTEVKVYDGKIYIIEIGCRLGGDYITSHLVPLATGFDLLNAALDLAMGNEINIIKSAKNVACVQYLNHENYITCNKYIEAGNGRVEDFIIKEYHQDPIQSSLQRMGHIILTADTYDDLEFELKILNGK